MLSVKSPDHVENEDFLLHAWPLVGVLDGVTAPPNLDSGCIHKASWYVQRLATHLAQLSTSEHELTDVLAQAIQAVSSDHGDTCDLTNPYTPAAALCLVRCKPDHLEYLILSDCTLVADVNGSITVLTDTRLAALIAEARQAANADQAIIGSPERRQLEHEVTLHKHTLTNQPHGYWIASSNPQAAHNAVTGTLPTTGHAAAHRFALLTDGVSRAVETFHLMDWLGLLDTLAAHGPEHLIQQIRQAELTDTRAAQRPRHKPHDDASVIYCSLQPEAS